MGRVASMTVRELSARMADDRARLIDVRTEEEWGLARIDGFRRLDSRLASELDRLDRGTELVFLCHHGVRSDAAARHFLSLGFERVWNVVGGIDAWSREIDPNVPRY